VDGQVFFGLFVVCLRYCCGTFLDELGNLQKRFTSNSEVWFRIFCGLRTGM